MNFCRLSSGGGASVPSSALVPNALPGWRVSHHRTGGSHMYGPSIFISASELHQVATLSRVGFCQCRVLAVLLYVVRCAEVTGQSLPKAQRKGLAWARRARIWLFREAFATCSCSAVQRLSFSHSLQHTNPDMSMTPAWSARSYSSSFPTVPSRRIVLRPLSLTYRICAASVFVSQRCNMSHT